MALTIIQLRDEEDGCSVAMSVDSEHSGVLVYCTDNHGDRVSMVLDSQLVKHLCNQVSKTIKARAKKINNSGVVSNVALPCLP
jgi:macrodomain Ter protein organizer (MatP/YcbG family)